MHLTIRGRLVAVVGLALLPIVLLTYLFIAQSQKDIAFSSKEVLGTQYYAALAADLAALSGLGPLPSASAFDAARSALDAALGTAERAQTYARLRATAPAPARSAETSAALMDLLSKVGDASNLILDPDLDSYYVMDILVVKLPVAFDSGTALLATLRDVAALPTEDGRIALVAQRGAFDAIVKSVETSLAASIAGNADGQVKLHLSAPIAAFASAGAAYAREIDAAGDAIARGLPVEVSKAADAQRSFVSAADAVNRAANAELTRLLEVRIGGFASRLATMLLIASALVVTVFAVCFIFARSILAIIRRLERDIIEVADQKPGASITHAGARDEIAAIARAVAYLQKNTVERLEQADRERRASAEESARLERSAVAAREENLRLVEESSNVLRAFVIELSAALQRLASGHLDCLIDTPRSGDLESLRLSFNRTVEELQAMVRQMRENSSSLRTATSEILAGSNDLAARTARQTGTVEKTTLSIRKVSDVVTSNVGLVKDAASNGSAVSRTAGDTASALTEAANAMSRIADSSARISNIIGVIDDIAFQTNLLALNASVEAARAGDAGQGFAVVAIEVRRLAQSAASASADVKALIEESGGYVAEGSRLVTGTAELLKAMLEAAGRNAQLLDAIASHSAEQLGAIGDIRAAFATIEEITQQNASLVEQTNAAIGQTESLANDLDTLVGRFRSEQRTSRAA